MTPSRHRLQRQLAFAALLMLCPPMLHAQEAARAASAAAAAPNAVTQGALQVGMQACAGRVEQVSRFVGFSSQAGAVLMPPPAQPDKHLVPLAMEVPTEAGPAFVSAAFAPNQANGCGATYDAVVFWPQACAAVAAQRFAGLRVIGLLKQHITVLDGGTTAKVFLMPAGSGCVSIKKELLL